MKKIKVCHVHMFANLGMFEWSSRFKTLIVEIAKYADRYFDKIILIECCFNLVFEIFILLQYSKQKMDVRT